MQPYAYSAVFVAKLSEVSPRPWSTRLLRTVRSRVWSVTSVRRDLPRERDWLSTGSPDTLTRATLAQCDKTFVCKFSLGSHKRKVHIVEYGFALTCWFGSTGCPF